MHNSQWIQSYLVLYSFCAYLLHSLIMWLIVSSLSPYNQYLCFFGVLSILALISQVIMALFCAAIRRDSVSLLRFPFLSHVQIFPCEMPLVSRSTYIIITIIIIKYKSKSCRRLVFFLFTNFRQSRLYKKKKEIKTNWTSEKCQNSNKVTQLFWLLFCFFLFFLFFY